MTTKFIKGGEKAGFFETDIVEIDFKSVIHYFNRLITLGSTKFILMANEIKPYFPPLSEKLKKEKEEKEKDKKKKKKKFDKTEKSTDPDEEEKEEDEDSDEPEYPTFNDLLESGTLFMDAIAYFSLPSSKRPPSLGDRNASNNPETPGHLLYVAKALYFFYFMYMVRGSMPPKETRIETPIVPKFVYETMNIRGVVSDWETRIASFSMTKISPEWIRYITIPNLGIETRQRLQLNLAGYRMFKPIQFVDPDEDISDELKTAIQAIRNFLKKGPFWEMHSVTRSEAVTSNLGVINANLGNLILKCYTEETIDQMVTDRLIFKKPVRVLNAEQHKNWTDEDFAGFKEKIFVVKK